MLFTLGFGLVPPAGCADWDLLILENREKGTLCAYVDVKQFQESLDYGTRPTYQVYLKRGGGVLAAVAIISATEDTSIEDDYSVSRGVMVRLERSVADITHRIRLDQVWDLRGDRPVLVSETCQAYLTGERTAKTEFLTQLADLRIVRKVAELPFYALSKGAIPNGRRLCAGVHARAGTAAVIRPGRGSGREARRLAGCRR